MPPTFSSSLASASLASLPLASLSATGTVGVAESICLYLETTDLNLNFSGAGQKNLIVNWIPDGPEYPDTIVSVFERSGLPTRLTMTGMGQPQSLLDQPVVQIRVRAAQGEYVAGNTLMQQVWGNLNGLSEVELPTGGLLFHLLNANGFPQYLGRDVQQRHEWSLNLHVIVENTQRVPA